MIEFLLSQTPQPPAKSRNHQVAKRLFWIAVLLLLIWVGYSAYSDMKRRPVECAQGPTTASAFLNLKEADVVAKEVKAFLLVPALDAKQDELLFETVTQGSDPGDLRFEPRLQLSATATPQNTAGWLAIQFPFESQGFWYPFDDYQMNVRMSFKRKSNSAAIKLQVRNNIVDLILEPCSAQYSFQERPTQPNSFSISLRRHRFVRATAIILYLVAFAFLYYIARREEFSTVLANSLGYMASLWGIRQIIMGSARLFPTIIDLLTLLLYLAVVAIVAYKWIEYR